MLCYVTMNGNKGMEIQYIPVHYNTMQYYM